MDASNIFKQTPTISEDTLLFVLHLPENITETAEASALGACIQDYVDELLPDFIWHRDPFQTKLVKDEYLNQWVLEGIMRVGDCVDDEWCAVWLLRQISAKWDIVISVVDNDGDLLLIEAAEAVETVTPWVKPSNSENRVWIYSSRLHLIPVTHRSKYPENYKRRNPLLHHEGFQDEDQDEFLDPAEALKLVRNDNINTIAPREVEELVWGRISGYPDAARSHFHKTKAWLPLDISKALTVNPQLVQKAVEAFYTRDAIQLRSAHRMSRFPPHTSILTTVTMTRPAYAQLVGQKFFPPKIFGRWTEPEGSTALRWKDVGMKLACGFEMLFQENKTSHITPSHGSTPSRAGTVEASLKQNPEFLSYMSTLSRTTYFQGSVEGSEQWKSLESKAVDFYTELHRADDSHRPSFNAMISTAISQATKEASPKPEDSDDWMNVDAKDFDEMLEKTLGGNAFDASSLGLDDAEERAAEAQAARLRDLADKVEEFVEGEGDLEGARFADDVSSDDDSDSDVGMASPDDSSKDVKRQMAMDSLVAPIDATDYGKMPASYHGNSQRVKKPQMEDVDELTEEESTPNTAPPAQPNREPLLPRDEYDGVVDEDSESDMDEEDDEDVEDLPQVVGDVEVDMEEEEEEFLEFTRQILGISDEQWNGIIKDRQGRGAFLPAGAKPVKPQPHPKENKSAPSQDTPMKAPPPVLNPTGQPNPELDSFESVMQAMEDHLAQIRASALPTQNSSSTTPKESKGKGKGKLAPKQSSSNLEDIESALDAEFQALIQRDEEEGDDEENLESSTDYNLIKNFLESFKSQGGLSGPVSNLAGRLQPEWNLPRDSN